MKRLILSISTGFAFFLISVAISFFITPLILKQLSKEEYAIFYLLNNIIVWFGLLRLGQTGSFKYQLSLSLHRKKYISILYSTLIISYSFLTLIFFMLGLFLHEPLLKWLKIPSLYKHEAMIAYMLLLVNLGISGISFLFSNLLAVYNKEYKANFIRIVLLVVQTILTIFLLKHHQGILSLALPILLTGIASCLFLILIIIKESARPEFNIKYFNLKVLKKTLIISRWFFIGFLAQLLIKYTDIILIGKLVNIKSVTGFLLTAKLYLIASGIFQMVIKTVTPHLVILSKKNKLEHSKLAWLYLKVTLIAAVLIGGLIFIGNEYFLEQWLGKGFFMGKAINSLLFLSFILMTLNLTLRSILLSNADLKTLKKGELLEAITNFTLSIFLGLIMGTEGILIATCAASLFILLTYLCKASNHAIPANYLFNFRNNLTELIALIAAFMIAIWVVKNNTTFSPITYFCFSIIMFFAAAYFVRKELRELFQRTF